VRLIGLVEGVSFLLLLGVAMPLKYLADIPMAVKIAGWAHGVLFVALMVAVQRASEASNWGHKRPALIMLAAFLPFGPFLIDGSLKREDQAAT